jgi:hypothetical protein
MRSTTELLEPVNGCRARKTVIGTVTLDEPIERRLSYETASWYTLVDVPPGEYEVYILRDRGLTWAMIGYRGKVTKEHFVNRLFTSSSIHEPTERIGKEVRATVQTYPYCIAESFMLNPRFTLAEDWSLGVEERHYGDGRPYAAFHLIDPEGNRVH